MLGFVFTRWVRCWCNSVCLLYKFWQNACIPIPSFLFSKQKDSHTGSIDVLEINEGCMM